MTALAALHRAHEAWRKTEPQLFWTNEVLWPESGLDAQQPSALLCVEPASDPLNLPPGAGSKQAPNRATKRGRELTAFGSRVAPAARSAGSAPLSTTTAPPAHPSLGRRGRGDWRSS